MKKYFLIPKIWFYILLLVIGNSHLAFSSGTAVGNGGDPILQFLEATRLSILDTLRIIEADPKEKESFCSRQSQLNANQKDLCRQFYNEVVASLFLLNRGENKVGFVLSQEPLYVEGPNGEPMSVAARTILGPNGVIQFHRDSIENYTPYQDFFLIVHELGHKVSFRNHYVEDREWFTEGLNGRDLLDNFASALLEVAKRKSRLQGQFGIRDNFFCKIVQLNNTQGRPYLSRLSSSRHFLKTDFSEFETSLSRLSSDPSLAVGELGPSRIVFRFLITEKRGCLDQASDEERNTKVNLVRVFDPLRDGTIPPEQIISEEVWTRVNPICHNEQMEFVADFENIRFSCRYDGSEGVTSLP